MEEIVIFVTTASVKEAKLIGRLLVEEGLAACANILPAVSSIFFWEGKVCEEDEILLILKSRKSCFDRLSEMVKKHHSYSVPEIIALPIIVGSDPYLKWIRESTR